MCIGRDAVPSEARPRWGCLFAILPLAIGALALVEVTGAALPLRAAAGAGIALATFGAMAWWVHANRSAIAQLERCSCASRSITVRVIRSGVGQPRGQRAPAPLSLAVGSAPRHAQPAGATLGM